MSWQDQVFETAVGAESINVGLVQMIIGFRFGDFLRGFVIFSGGRAIRESESPRSTGDFKATGRRRRTRKPGGVDPTPHPALLHLKRRREDRVPGSMSMKSSSVSAALTVRTDFSRTSLCVPEKAPGFFTYHRPGRHLVG
jgi:hypothetical protein